MPVPFTVCAAREGRGDFPERRNSVPEERSTFIRGEEEEDEEDGNEEPLVRCSPLDEACADISPSNSRDPHVTIVAIIIIIIVIILPAVLLAGSSCSCDGGTAGPKDSPERHFTNTTQKGHGVTRPEVTSRSLLPSVRHLYCPPHTELPHHLRPSGGGKPIPLDSADINHAIAGRNGGVAPAGNGKPGPLRIQTIPNKCTGAYQNHPPPSISLLPPTVRPLCLGLPELSGVTHRARSGGVRGDNPLERGPCGGCGAPWGPLTSNPPPLPLMQAGTGAHSSVSAPHCQPAERRERETSAAGGAETTAERSSRSRREAKSEPGTRGASGEVPAEGAAEAPCPQISSLRCREEGDRRISCRPSSRSTGETMCTRQRFTKADMQPRLLDTGRNHGEPQGLAFAALRHGAQRLSKHNGERCVRWADNKTGSGRSLNLRVPAQPWLFIRLCLSLPQRPEMDTLDRFDRRVVTGPPRAPFHHTDGPRLSHFLLLRTLVCGAKIVDCEGVRVEHRIIGATLGPHFDVSSIKDC
ncbi:hypothetical protein SKAU_G00108210 [Synaphobranchus kaupii]|uniref:Uncharacterized protein n=1 Tax=Synaphobranchus kaupii TaxID=118154 RepID=A0A9Q1FZR4_SYNKA|nr:hypothetical protein SKAU_G00108210 [Synaphobranchus kaupii]